MAVLDKENRQSADLENLSKAVNETLAFLMTNGGISAFEFADGAYHTHQLAKELAFLLIQQGNNLTRKKEIDVNVSGFVSLQLAMARVEAWLASWDKPPENHPNIFIQGDVDHDFQSWLKTSLAHLTTEEAQRFLPKTASYEDAVMGEAKALADGYRRYVDVASKQKSEQRPWWRFW